MNKKDKRRSSIHDITSAGIPGGQDSTGEEWLISSMRCNADRCSVSIFHIRQPVDACICEYQCCILAKPPVTDRVLRPNAAGSFHSTLLCRRYEPQHADCQRHASNGSNYGAHEWCCHGHGYWGATASARPTDVASYGLAGPCCAPVTTSSVQYMMQQQGVLG